MASLALLFSGTSVPLYPRHQRWVTSLGGSTLTARRSITPWWLYRGREDLAMGKHGGELSKLGQRGRDPAATGENARPRASGALDAGDGPPLSRKACGRAAGWLVDHHLLWPLTLQPPWWILTDYPSVNDQMAFLDGGVNSDRDRDRRTGLVVPVACRPQPWIVAGPAISSSRASLIRSRPAGCFLV
jgi:hypothetical protein